MKIGAPWNWYEFDSKHSLSLLVNYSKKIERQIDNGIADFNKNKKSEFLVLSEEERIGQNVEHYDGLDSMSWNLNELHISYFPNLQRKSAFLTLYAFLEHELEKLGNKLKRESKLTAHPGDMFGQGVTRSLIYMQKVVGLKIEDNDSRWGRISDLNKLRNIIIHNDGRLLDHQGEKVRDAKVVNQFQKHLVVADDEIILKATFLMEAINRFDELFKYLDSSIKRKYTGKRKRQATLIKKKRLKKKIASA